MNGNTRGLRIAERRNLMGYSPERLAKKLGVTRQAIYKWEKEDGIDIKGSNLRALAEILECSVDWLEFGKFEDAPSHALKVSDITPLARSSVEDDTVLIQRIVGCSLRAGTGEIVYDFEKVSDRSLSREWLQQRNLDPKHCVLWPCEGPSMYPTIEHGELVLVNLRERDPVDKKIYAIVTDDGLRLKRLIRKSDNTWEIRSDNEDKRLFPNEQFDVESVAIIGRVRWHSGEL